MLNPFLNAIQVTNEECELFDSMVIEAIQVVGVELTYLQLNESEHNGLNDAQIQSLKERFVIEAQIVEIQNFGGDMDMFGSFGLIPSETAVFKFSITRFKQEAEQLKMTEPREGDVLYDPVSNRLWEIRRVKTDDQYYIGNKRYCWFVNCVIYQPKHEEDFDLEGVVFQGSLGQITQPSQDESDLFEPEAESVVVEVAKFDVNNPFGE